MNLTQPTKLKEIRREWHLIDVKGEILGRISTKIAGLVMGKAKPYYVPNLDCGDFVVVVNARDIKVTGKKESTKTYSRYSGFPGGLKEKTYAQIKAVDPTRIILESVGGMVPNNKLKDAVLKRLYIFAGEDHPYKHKFSPK